MMLFTCADFQPLKAPLFSTKRTEIFVEIFCHEKELFCRDVGVKNSKFRNKDYSCRIVNAFFLRRGKAHLDVNLYVII